MTHVPVRGRVRGSGTELAIATKFLVPGPEEVGVRDSGWCRPQVHAATVSQVLIDLLD